MPSSTTQQAVKDSKPEFEFQLSNKGNSKGQVPASFARLTKLRLLGLSVNSLSGEFPPPLYDLSSLVISDPIYFPNFQILYLVKCQFIGSIPSSLANASKLLELHFPVNNFTRNIPKGFGNLRNLLWLNVWSNQLGYGKRDDLDLVNFLTNCQQSTNAPFEDNQFVEYGMGSKVSVLGDMYSFGILILEIFTGRRPTDTLFQASSSLHDFVETALPEKVMEILDKTTFHGAMSKATNSKEYWSSIKKEEMECLVSILEVGVACSAESARDRLTMTQVYKSDVLGDDKAGSNGHGENVPKRL
ncbi:hypothetical protein KY290_018086 [Solanum tuberosum]|uniref:Serine-threonine protein kinase, plant-type n=1 Tax=Solanum tuberosum TaxID=4113 RepID=A0ABQ7VE00_SOLTU|nr:hypothetical protein KY290_018086 [Solanum tuberosum]